MPERRAALLSTTAFLHGLRGGLLVSGALGLVVLIALLDYATGPYLSFGIFYLIPVILCAWWGGFSPGILLSLAGAVAWHLIDGLENPLILPAVGIWNAIVRFGTLALIASLVSRLHIAVLRERVLARTDPLTGAANGRTFYETVAQEAERGRRTSRPLTLAYLDLDDFKKLNDRLGHAAGDAALVHVVLTIHSQLRSADLLARLGGDEFALLLPETEAAGAAALLVRLQELLAQEMAHKGWPVTLSVGAITFLQAPADVDLMIRQVDTLMYKAKRKGKGRVEHKVVDDARAAQVEDQRWIERRATARVICNCTARVRPEGIEPTQGEFATIRDISAEGLGVYLDSRFPPDTVLIVEPLSPGVKALLVRVVHTTSDSGGWKHGCEVSTRLSAQDLVSWLGEPLEASAT